MKMGMVLISAGFLLFSLWAYRREVRIIMAAKMGDEYTCVWIESELLFHYVQTICVLMFLSGLMIKEIGSALHLVIFFLAMAFLKIRFRKLARAINGLK